MRISDLAEHSGVSVASIKFYLREGVLQPGIPVNAREKAYDDRHLARIRLIRGLMHVLGASISQVRDVLSAIETPDHTFTSTVGEAMTTLYPDDSFGPIDEDELATTSALLDQLGFDHEPDTVAVRHLHAVLRFAVDVGIPIDVGQLTVYADAARQVASADFNRIPWDDPTEAIEFAVLGTALYEPILLALRRIAHFERSQQLGDLPPGGP